MTNSQLQEIIKSTPDSLLVEKAFKFAEEAHRGQKRLSGQDYIFHPLKVAQTLKKMGLDSKTVAAGLLHDVPDDTLKTLEDIEKEFGKEIAFLVEGVSKLGKLRYPKEELEIKSIEIRKERPIDLRAENLRKMFFAMAEDLRVILIKLADRLDNMETLNFLPSTKQQRIALETLEIFAPLADRLGIGEIKAQLEDLAFPYLYPKEYEWLIKNVKEKYEEREKHLKKIKSLLTKLLKKEGIQPLSIHSRPKHYWSLYQKLLKHEMNFERIHDLIALRIIVEDVKNCYAVLGIIHKFWKPLPGRIKDYIAFPKPNGYQALHTTCFSFGGQIIEIQIKTKKMHEEAEYGVAAHWAMKEGVDLKREKKRFAWVRQLRNWRRKILKSKKRINLEAQKKKFAWVQELKDWQAKVSDSEDFLKGLKIDFFKNRIFVFTPKGDIIDLPDGASPVDFAYAVHTEIGHHCAGAKINSKIAPLSQQLKNGDIVEIIVDKKRGPSRDWLEFVKTNLARSRIKSWLKQEDRPENFRRGIKLLDETFRQFQGKGFSNLSQTKKEGLLKAFPYKDLEGLIVAVGEGEISPREILKNFLKEKGEFVSSLKTHPRLFWKPSFSPAKPLKKQKEKGGILLAGERRIQTYLAKCCLPQPGDLIKAYITKSRGASVHKISCRNLIKIQKNWPEKIIEANWEKEEKALYPISIRIKAQDRLGLFRDISSVINAMNIKILSYRTRTQSREKETIVEAKIEVSGLEELDKLFGQLKQISDIQEIRKL